MLLPLPPRLATPAANPTTKQTAPTNKGPFYNSRFAGRGLVRYRCSHGILQKGMRRQPPLSSYRSIGAPVRAVRHGTPASRSTLLSHSASRTTRVNTVTSWAIGDRVAGTPQGCNDGAMATMHPHLVSIGYEGRSVDDLVNSLLKQDVQVLVDVRLNPISRKPGLSKTALSTALNEAGITYIHHRELGNPKDNRDDFRRGTPESHARFRALLGEEKGAAALRHVSELLEDSVVALLCFERDHSECHRTLVVDAIAQQDPGLSVAHV